MKVVCPICQTAFQMPDSALDAEGRRVRCGACAHVWRVYPDTEADESGGAKTEAEAAAPTDDSAPAQAAGFGAGSYDDAGNAEGPPGDDTPSGDPFAALQADLAAEDRETDFSADSPLYDSDNPVSEDDDDIYGAAGLPALPRRRSRLVAFGWIAYALFVATLAGGLLFFRAPLVAAWPPLDGLYAVLEVAPPSAENALRVDIDPQPVWEQSGDGWTMTVNGTVTNISDRTLVLPPLQIELVDQRSASVRTQEARIESRRLEPDETATLVATIRNAPEQARGIDYRWETPGE